MRPELVRFSITENGGTALHVAASAYQISRRREKFVKNLVDLMKEQDLALENEDFNTALYLAVAAGNLEAVNIMVKKNRGLLVIPGAGGQMMPLNAAAVFGYHSVVRYLYYLSNELRDDGWTNQNRAWLLENCVENDIFDIGLQIVKAYPELCSGSVLGLLARKPDAFYEQKSTIIKQIINLVPEIIEFTKKESETGALQLLRIVWENILKQPRNVTDDILRGPPDLKQDDKLSAFGNVEQALQLLVDIHVENQNMIRDSTSGTEDRAHRLQKLISEHIANIHVDTQNIIKGPSGTYSSRIMFVAAEMGNTKFLVELIRRYPDLMWQVNDNNQTIFHIAVQYRHEGIYNLLYEVGSMKDSISTLKDENGNNILHLVGKIANKKRNDDVSGAVFQMQRELLWFHEVRHMIPPAYRQQKNNDGLTPYELFTKEHENLRTQGEKWIKGVANQGMVVAALTATIVFAAAITVPGGYNQDTGIPMFYKKQAYLIFVMADSISLFTSSASIFMFLSILTSRYNQSDFLESVPKKLFIFLSTLIISITFMMIAFSISFLVLYKDYLKWMLFIIGFAAMQVVLFVQLQYPLLLDVIRSTYSSRYLFRPKKRVLYYQYPRF